MNQFNSWIEASKAGSYVVRYRDRANKKRTYKVIGRDERAFVDGEIRSAKWLAHQYLEKLRSKYHLGELNLTDPSEKVADLVSSYHSQCAGNNLAHTTLRHYEISLRRFVEECKIRLLADLTSERISEWKVLMVKQALEISTMRGRLADLRVFLAWLVETKKLDRSPFGPKTMPSKKRKEPQYYTRAEFMALNSVLAQMEPMAQLACNLAHDMGLRKIEIVGDGMGRLGALWEDIQWLKDGKAELILRNEVVKGQKHGRTIPLTPGILNLLGNRSSGPLVRLTRSQFDHFFAKARLIAEISPTLNIHGLRHTFAKNYLQSGGNLAGLQELLGHTDITTTQIYSKLEKSYLAQGVELAYERRVQDEAMLCRDGQNDGQVTGKLGAFHVLPYTPLPEGAQDRQNGIVSKK